MANEDGNYVAQLLVKPDLLLELFDVPDGFSVRWISFNEDRMAWVMVLDTPTEEQYFVPHTQMIPVLPVSIVREDNGQGEKLCIRLPSVAKETEHSDNPPKPTRRRTRNSAS